MKTPPAFCLLVILAGGCSSVPAGVQPTADVTIPLTRYFRDLRSTRVQVGDDTLTMLLDTGGGASLITPAIASRLGCRAYGRDAGHRMTGELVEFKRCDSLAMAVAGWKRTIAPVAVFDVNALLPAELPRVDGVMALDTFDDQVVTIDWPNDRLIVHASGTSSSQLASHGIPIRVASGESGRMLSAFVRVDAARGSLWLLLDSGNLRGTLMDVPVSTNCDIKVAR